MRVWDQILLPTEADRMVTMRTYETYEDMFKVAKSQWRAYFSARTSGEIVEKWSDEELETMAGMTISEADNTGEYFDGETQLFTMEMESWARGEMDGIEAEIIIGEE